uniref:Uncharacterized protein n=1 Tax=Glossina palpalis gambiensis TaxID=67801 RepID=A0A1B0BB46_9MUSC
MEFSKQSKLSSRRTKQRHMLLETTLKLVVYIKGLIQYVALSQLQADFDLGENEKDLKPSEEKRALIEGHSRAKADFKILIETTNNVYFNNQILWYDKNREKSSINTTTTTHLYFPINNTTTGPFSITIRIHIDGSTTLCIHSICFKQGSKGAR